MNFRPSAKAAKTSELGIRLHEMYGKPVDDDTLVYLAHRISQRDKLSLSEVRYMRKVFSSLELPEGPGVVDANYILFTLLGGYAGLAWVYETLDELDDIE